MFTNTHEDESVGQLVRSGPPNKNILNFLIDQIKGSIISIVFSCSVKRL